MTKLTFSKTRKILIVLLALALTGGFCAGFFYFLFTEPHSVMTWTVMFPLFAIFATLSVLGIRQAFCAYCSFDDEAGIEFYYGFAKRARIPVSALVEFLTLDDGIDIRYKKIAKGEEKIKSLKVTAEFQRIQSLCEWLDAHARNVYAELVETSVREYREEHSALSDEAKAALFKKTHRAARVLNWLGIAVAALFFASVFKGGRLEQAMLAVCAAYPIFVLLLLRASRGELRFNARKIGLHPSVASAFTFCMLALLVVAVAYFDHIYRFSKMLGVAAVAALCVLAVYYACACDAERRDSAHWYSAGFLCVVFFCYALGAAGTVNVVFDKSEPVVYEAVVLNQRVSHGKHTDYYLEVSPWIDGKTERKEISVGSKLYKKIQTGDTVHIRLYGGLLGIPYFFARVPPAD